MHLSLNVSILTIFYFRWLKPLTSDPLSGLDCISKCDSFIAGSCTLICWLPIWSGYNMENRRRSTRIKHAASTWDRPTLKSPFSAPPSTTTYPEHPLSLPSPTSTPSQSRPDDRDMDWELRGRRDHIIMHRLLANVTQWVELLSSCFENGTQSLQLFVVVFSL